nr:hypothetical protein [Armatimonadota bacterium]
HLKSTAGIRVGYTGPPNPEYIAADPLITSVDADGTAHLSAPLPIEIKTGPFRLQELKYQPFQGAKLKDGTVTSAPDTFNGWIKYAAAVGREVRHALGTEGQPDAGFDVEVWNEQTFGSNFLDINHYYSPPLQFAQPFVYSKDRPMKATYRPGATLHFEQKDAYAILPMTIDYFNDPANGFPGVNVFSGFANQWPWDNGTGLWDGQAGFSRHYYTGGWTDCSPDTPLGNKGIGTIDALGNFDGKKDNKDWHTIIPGTAFVPTFRSGFPEFLHSGFKTESLSRDVIPDSRLSDFAGHGRYTNNGDFRPAQVWETEVNYYRRPFFDQVIKDTGAKQDDPRLLALDEHMAGKMLLRQYLFHNHKGLYRIEVFALAADPFSFGMFPPAFYAALDKSNDVLTDAVRATIPPEFRGMAWMKKVFDGGEPLAAPRPLEVKDLVEYKPRLVFAGDGTPAHPDVWNRDWFAVLPYQLTASRFVIPYYVVTLDVSHAWRKALDRLDPARYDMPDQDFDVTLGNVAGKGAVVSAYDPLSNTAVPVQVISSTGSTLTVRLKAVDYPRILQVTEKQPGPQILDPKVTLTPGGDTMVTWHANEPAEASLTYGHDWTGRRVNQVDVAKGKLQYSVPLHATTPGVLAARIKLTANGITDIWPHWDEDPAGQVVIPGTPVTTPAANATPANPPVTLTPAAPPTPLTSPAGLRLPVVVTDAARGYSLALPAGAVLGSGDDRETTLGAGDRAVTLRVRYLPGAAKAADDQLPFTAPGDSAERQNVSLPSGMTGTLALYQLTPAAHPGMTNLRQRYLLLPAGADKSDLIILSATGTATAMTTHSREIEGVFASVKGGK